MIRPFRKVLIIGAGIAGPALALFLQRAGVEVMVYEGRPEPDSYEGLFLNLATNGIHVLEALNLDTEVTEEGFSCPRMVMWNGDGKRLGEVPNGAVPGRSSQVTSQIIRRGALQRILIDALKDRGIRVHYGKRVTDLRAMGSGAEVFFEDGTSAVGDLVVGCDGTHSKIRGLMDPDAPQPVYTKQISCGGFARCESLSPTPDTQHFIFGKRAFFGYLVKPSGEIYWFSNLDFPESPRRSYLQAIPREAWESKLCNLFHDDQPFIREIIRSTIGEIGCYPIYAFRRCRSGTRGRSSSSGTRPTRHRPARVKEPRWPWKTPFRSPGAYGTYRRNGRCTPTRANANGARKSWSSLPGPVVPTKLRPGPRHVGFGISYCHWFCVD